VTSTRRFGGSACRRVVGLALSRVLPEHRPPLGGLLQNCQKALCMHGQSGAFFKSAGPPLWTPSCNRAVSCLSFFLAVRRFV